MFQVHGAILRKSMVTLLLFAKALSKAILPYTTTQRFAHIPQLLHLLDPSLVLDLMKDIAKLLQIPLLLANIWSSWQMNWKKRTKNKRENFIALV